MAKESTLSLERLLLRLMKGAGFLLLLFSVGASILPAAYAADGNWEVYWPGERLPIIDYLEEYPDHVVGWGNEFYLLQEAWSEGYVETHTHWDLGTISVIPEGERYSPVATMLLKTIVDPPFENANDIGNPNKTFRTRTTTRLLPAHLTGTTDQGQDIIRDCYTMEELRDGYVAFGLQSELITIAGKPAVRLYSPSSDIRPYDDGSVFFTVQTLITYLIKVDEPTDRNMTILELEAEYTYYNNAPADQVDAAWEDLYDLEERAAQMATRLAQSSFYYEALMMDGEGSGASLEITTPAAKDPGEKSYFVPAAIASAIIAGGLTYLGTRKKKRGQKPEPEEAEETAGSSYEMRINKNFGDTIRVGERLPIYGQIIEITPQGAEIPRPDLSEKILISSPHYLEISGQAMTGGYKGAYIDAPEADSVPPEAQVSFRFAGGGASFTNNLVFKIEREKILFGQDNLTLPANYEKTERLPFIVLGMGEEAAVSVSLTPAGGYEVTVERGAEEGLYYALIKEQKKTGGKAGDYESYTLTATAENQGRSITGELPIYRFHMGLRLDVGPINCFAEEYDPQNHSSNKFLFRADGKDYVPAETKGVATIYDWDPEEHCVIEIAPGYFDFAIKAESSDDQALLDKIAIQCEILDARVGGGRALVFRPCQGELDAPTRIDACITLKATYREQELQAKESAMLCSQPLRETKDPAEAMALIKADAHITDRLIYIRSEIFGLNLVNNLFPLLRLIDAMLDGYHADFGYDAYQVGLVRDVWGGFLQGDIMGANAEPERVTLGDEVRLFISSFLETAEKVDQSLGFMGRMALGVATLGCSNITFTALQVAKAMSDEAAGEKDSSTFDVFIVGAKIVTVDYLMGKAMEKGIKTGKGLMDRTGVTTALGEMKDQAKESAKKYSSALLGKNTRRAINDSAQAGKQAARQADLVLATGRQKALKTPQQLEMDRALKAGREFGQEQVQNLQAAVWMYEQNPTPVNRRLLNQVTLNVQENKLAMYALQDTADSGLDSTRRAFNRTLMGFYQEADELTKIKLAQAAKVPASRIEILNASANAQAPLLQGKRVTMDRDWTGYYTNAKGERIYFDQALTEQIYNDSFFEVTQGFKSADPAFANRLAEKMDQTVIQDVLGHRESYGNDLSKMLDKTLHAQALNDPSKVARTVSGKGKDWFGRSKRMLRQAELVSDRAQRQLLQGQALGLEIEGYRQLVKQYDNCVLPRDVARSLSPGSSKIPANLRASVEFCRRLLTPKSTINLSDVENILNSFGFTKESMADALGKAVRSIG